MLLFDKLALLPTSFFPILVCGSLCHRGVKHNCDLSIQRPRSLQDSVKATLEKHGSRQGTE